MVFKKGHPFYLGAERNWFKKGCVPWNKNKKMPKEFGEGISKRQIGKKLSQKHKDAIKKSMKGKNPWVNFKNPEESKRKISDFQRGTKHSKEHKRNIGLASKKNWKNPEYREKVIRGALKGFFKRPTSLEKKFINFCEKYQLPFKYCGNGSLLIGYKNPDFFDVNGKKICIETASKFFKSHSPPKEYETKRIKHFGKYGWKCLVIWDDEIFKDKHYRIEVENWESNILKRLRWL